MGVRLYDPALGRFLEVDPIEGGSANDYDYCAGDPINCFDLGGTMLTPENKVGNFLVWFAGLTKDQQKQMKENVDPIAAGAIRQAGPPPASAGPPRASAPALPELNLTRPGATAANSPNRPSGSSNAGSIGCIASGVGVVTGVVGVAIATDGLSLLVSGVGGGASVVGIATSC